MHPLRFILGIMAFFLVWLVVFLGVGWLIGFVFQPQNGAHFLGVWLDAHALPGLAIGLFMGFRAFRAIYGKAGASARLAPPTGSPSDRTKA
jgi:hypothetical protein